MNHGNHKTVPALRLWQLSVGWAIPWFLMFIAPHSVLLLLACTMGGMKWTSGIVIMLTLDAVIIAAAGRLSFECRLLCSISGCCLGCFRAYIP